MIEQTQENVNDAHVLVKAEQPEFLRKRMGMRYNVLVLMKSRRSDSD
jgi:hypothetical protein